MKFKNIALVKEIESPENPSGLEKRVALTPSDIGKLVSYGAKIFVEFGSGANMGFNDSEYIRNGAIMQNASEIYLDKDLIIKFKGPSLESIKQMKECCTLFCMVHFDSFPKRAQMLKNYKINVMAMEEIVESPKKQCTQEVLSRVAMSNALENFIENGTINKLRIFILGYSERLAGSMRRAGNRNPLSLSMLNEDIEFNELTHIGSETLYFYDSKNSKNLNEMISKLKENNSHIFDLSEFEDNSTSLVEKYLKSHAPFEFGKRVIQCLHETGQAGARYGIKLLKNNKPSLNIKTIKAVVLGYGNVARGAINELYDNGIKHIHILGKKQTSKEEIRHWLNKADLIINGAEQEKSLRGINFLIENKHLKEIIPNNSVIIDLVGGSKANRSPVETVLECTFLTNPHFVQDNVTISALWGWPMMGMEKESTIKYSSQITDVLVGENKLINGLHDMRAGVKRGLVCGIFE